MNINELYSNNKKKNIIRKKQFQYLIFKLKL